MKVDTVTIFRTWVEICDTFNNEDRGILYHGICRYALDGVVPDLPAKLSPFFELMKPSIEKSQHRKIAQLKSRENIQKHHQANLQNDVQTSLQNDVQNNVQSDIARTQGQGQGYILKEKKKNNKKEKKPLLIPEAYSPIWNTWTKYLRERTHRSIPEGTAQRQLAMLTSYDPSNARTIVEYSITCGYAALFPPKDLLPNQNQRKDYSAL